MELMHKILHLLLTFSRVSSNKCFTSNYSQLNSKAFFNSALNSLSLLNVNYELQSFDSSHVGSHYEKVESRKNSLRSYTYLLKS